MRVLQPVAVVEPAFLHTGNVQPDELADVQRPVAGCEVFVVGRETKSEPGLDGLPVDRDRLTS
jgi:hypothetical protein